MGEREAVKAAASAAGLLLVTFSATRYMGVGWTEYRRTASTFSESTSLPTSGVRASSNSGNRGGYCQALIPHRGLRHLGPGSPVYEPPV